MTFTAKDWRNATAHDGGGDTSTPLSAVAIEDLETRVTDYTDLHGAAESVKDAAYGALGDGATDDTAAFQATATGAGVGGHVYVPPGTYILDGADLTVAAQRWTLAPGAILKLKNSATNPYVLDLDAERIILEGGEVNGNRANNGSIDPSTGVIQVHRTGIRVRDIYVHDGPGFSVYGTAAAAATPINDIEINNIRSVDCIQGGVFFNLGTPTTPSTGIRILNCWSDNSALAVGTIQGGGGGVFCLDATTEANQPRDVVIHGCYAKSRTDATIQEAGIGATNCNGVHVSDCYTRDHSFCGYTLVKVRELTVTNCHDFGSVDYGFEIGGHEDDDNSSATVTGCTANGNGGVTGAGFIFNTIQDAVISGCVSASVDVGIAVANPDSETTTGPFTASGNICHATTYGIAESDTLGGNYQYTDNVIVIYGGAPGGNMGIRVDWSGASTRSMTRVYNGNLIFGAEDGLYFVGPGGGITISDVIARGNSFFSCSTNIDKDATITFNGTCSIVNETLAGYVP
jgi:hypothetical protein